METKLLKSATCNECNGSGLVSRTVFDKQHRDHIIFVSCNCMPKLPDGFARNFLKNMYNKLKERV